MLKNKKKLILFLITIFAFLGFLDAAFLTIKHFQGTLPPCSLALGCEKVLTSQYSTIVGIPIALLGSIFYLAVIGLAVFLFQKKDSGVASLPRMTSFWSLDPSYLGIEGLVQNQFQLLFLLTVSGFIVSLILFLIQAFILQAFCQYCLISEAITILLLIFSFYLLRSSSR